MPLLTRKELAEKIGVSPITIHRWKMERNLPFKQYGTKTVRYDWQEVQNWLDQQKGA